MLCIVYVIAVGICLTCFGLLIERILPSSIPRRLVWCLLILLSMAIPGYYRGHHTMSVTDAMQQPAAQPIGHALSLASLNVLDPSWWVWIASYDSVIVRAWNAASILLLIWGVANIIRVSLAVHRSRKSNKGHGEPTIVDGVPVVVTDHLGPATVGVLRSQVLVPRWVLALPAVQRKYVLCHEQQHRNAQDARLLFVASLTLVLAPWNIALWWMLQRLRLAVEMDCDDRVVSTLGDANAYGELLLKVAQAASRGPRLQPALLGTGMLERRLITLLAPTPLRHVQKVLVPATAIALLLLALWMPHPVLEHNAHNHSAMTTASTSSIQPTR